MQSNQEGYVPLFTIQDLIDVGAHLGHKTRILNPEMRYNLFGQKNGIHIIDVKKTYVALVNALNLFYKFAKNGKKILFVGTNPQFMDITKKYALECEQFYINDKWLGGILTNWYTVSKSIKKLLSYDKVLSDPESEENLTKKEMVLMKKNREKLFSAFGGIMEMGGRPDLVFVLDAIKDNLAIKECNVLGIPVVSIADTNSPIEEIPIAIPGNDNSIIASEFYLKEISKAILAGIKDGERGGSKVDIGNFFKKKEKNDDKIEKDEIVTKELEKEEINI